MRTLPRALSAPAARTTRPPRHGRQQANPLGHLAAAGAEIILLLIAVEAVLLVEPYSIRADDFAKTTHLRALVPLLAVLWGLCLWAQRSRAGSPVGSRTIQPGAYFALALAAVLATTALSTALSIAPSVSLWGDRWLTGGLLGVVAWVVVGGTAATVLRTWAQVDRLLRTLALAALCAALFGLPEVIGTNLMTVLPRRTFGLVSTLGNPIFFGSVLVLVLPFALAWFATYLCPSGSSSTNRRDSGMRLSHAAGGAATRLWLLVILGQLGVFGVWLALVRSRPDAAWLAPAILTVFVWLSALMPVHSAGAWRRAAPSYRTNHHAANARGVPAWKKRARRALPAVGLGLLVVVLVLALALTRARGPWLGGGAAAVLMAIWLYRPAWRRWAIVGVPTLAIAVALAGVLAGPVTGMATAWLTNRSPQFAARTLESRVLTWELVTTLVVAPPLLVDNPSPPLPRQLVGYGPQTLTMLAEQVRPLVLQDIEPDRRINSHNDMLEHLVSVGLLGTAAWLSLIASVLWAARSVYRQADPEQRILLGAILAGLFGYAIEQMVAPVYPPVRTLAWLLGGAIVGLAHGSGQGAQPLPATKVRWPLGFMAVTCVMILLLPGGRPPEQLFPAVAAYWLWALVGAAGLAWVMARPVGLRRLPPHLLLVSLIALAGGILLGIQGLRPLAAERLATVSALMANFGDDVPAVTSVAIARSVWPHDESYDALLGTTLIDLADAKLRAERRPPSRLPGPTPPPDTLDVAVLAQAGPEQLTDWAVWLLQRAAQRQRLEFLYPLAHATLYQRFVKGLHAPEAWTEAREALDRARKLSPTSPRVQELAEQLQRP